MHTYSNSNETDVIFRTMWNRFKFLFHFVFVLTDSIYQRIYASAKSIHSNCLCKKVYLCVWMCTLQLCHTKMMMDLVSSHSFNINVDNIMDFFRLRLAIHLCHVVGKPIAVKREPFFHIHFHSTLPPPGISNFFL